MTEITKRPAFNDANAKDFERWISQDGHTNKSVLTPQKRMEYRFWLNNPGEKVTGTREEKQKRYNDRNFALNHFELQRGQVYRKAETSRGIQYGVRLALCTWDSFRLVAEVHEELKHTGINKTFDIVRQRYYGKYLFFIKNYFLMNV